MPIAVVRSRRRPSSALSLSLPLSLPLVFLPVPRFCVRFWSSGGLALWRVVHLLDGTGLDVGWVGSLDILFLFVRVLYGHRHGREVVWVGWVVAGQGAVREGVSECWVGIVGEGLGKHGEHTVVGAYWCIVLGCVLC